MQHNKKKNKSLQYNKIECKLKSIKYFKKILGGKKNFICIWKKYLQPSYVTYLKKMKIYNYFVGGCSTEKIFCWNSVWKMCCDASCVHFHT